MEKKKKKKKMAANDSESSCSESTLDSESCGSESGVGAAKVPKPTPSKETMSTLSVPKASSSSAAAAASRSPRRKTKKSSALAVQDLRVNLSKSAAEVLVTVEKAKDLVASSKGDECRDCYCVLALANDVENVRKIESKKDSFATKVAKRSLSPAWHESVTLTIDDMCRGGPSGKLGGAWCVVAEIWDAHKKKHKCVGVARVQIKSLCDGEHHSHWHALQPYKKGAAAQGQIQLLIRATQPGAAVRKVALHGEQFVAIPSFITSSFWAQRILVELALTDCGIESVPESLLKLTQLERINLSGNRLRAVPAVFAQLPELRAIDVSYNLIESFSLEQIQRVAHLRRLHLEGNDKLQLDKLTLEILKEVLDRFTY
jgi:C2 domain/Leucine rich repeat